MNARMMYEELVDDLRRRREQATLAGGRLDAATEDAIAGELNIYWNKMRVEDRQLVEARLPIHELRSTGT